MATPKKQIWVCRETDGYLVILGEGKPTKEYEKEGWYYFVGPDGAEYIDIDEAQGQHLFGHLKLRRMTAVRVTVRAQRAR